MIPTRINSSSFNKAVMKEINELQDILEKINPEHIKELPSSLIRDIETVLPNKITYFGNMINSHDIEQVKACGQYLATSKVELIKIVSDFAVSVSSQEFVIDIPENFDGRNSFQEVRLLLSGVPNQLENFISTQGFTQDFSTPTGREVYAKIQVTPRKNSFVIDVKGLGVNQNSDHNYERVTRILFTAVLWRYI